MSKKRRKNNVNQKKDKENVKNEEQFLIHPEVKKNILIICLIGLIIILYLSVFDLAGVVGNFLYKNLFYLFGWGYYFLPLIFVILIISYLKQENRIKFFSLNSLGALILFLNLLGLIELIFQEKGGLVGKLISYIRNFFGELAAGIIMFLFILIGFLLIFNQPLKNLKKKKEELKEEEKLEIKGIEEERKIEKKEEPQIKINGLKEKVMKIVQEEKKEKAVKIKNYLKNYVLPPLSLLNTNLEKPVIGDLRANANIIKRTLESFGLSVEMGEVNVGPTITRYTLKPAEGIKLSKITALNQDLALALAAHPIRIEAPIPGKSLVGIEVPNKTPAIVRLGNLLKYEEFEKSDLLTFALGKDVSGEPVFTSIEKMPHLLIAGSTGSGKSIMIHSLIISLLYKNSPNTLKMILIDPKRVELSVYNDLPHLIAPTIIENKKAIGALRWAIEEMENRYQKLLEAGSRDIKTYNKKAEKVMPYILIIIDELADLMVSFGKEVEGAIIRLAQMARATGIHLIVSTQRPSVEVITGLIKANITSRIALQVASQVDSRTILDTAGAEKLLGRGDLLFINNELSKPKRIQGAFVSDEEIKKVIDFIKKNNKDFETEKAVEFEEVESIENNDFVSFEDYVEKEDDDVLFEKAVEVVKIAKKASASLLQRRLKIGYARAARLLDMMEERGLIGPAEGAKPREVYID